MLLSPTTVALFGAQILIALSACSQSTQTSATRSKPATSTSTTQADPFTNYDPSSLVALKKYSDLPVLLKAKIRADKASRDETVIAADSRLERMVVACGASTTSALVGYQVGDYVPQVQAIAYVRVSSGWVVARTWLTDVGNPQTFDALLFITDYLTKHPPKYG
jgi:hypothetical protein